MLPEVQTGIDPNLVGRLVKTIGKKSALTDIFNTDQAQQRLEAHIRDAFTSIGDHVVKLSLGKITNKSQFDEHVQNHGWESLVPLCSQIKKPKPGSQKDAKLKAIARFVKTLKLLQTELVKLQVESDTSGSSLDALQRDAITHIRQGKSVLLMGPPGSGKTHCALFTLDIFGLRHSNDLILYVSPTSELALQAFANLSETFPSLSIGIVTLLIAHLPKRPNIIVGTPQEIWSYLSTSGITWTTVIVDEVHTITDREMGYGDSLQYIIQGLSLNPPDAKVQIVALSATIHPDDVENLKNTLEALSAIPEPMVVITLPPSPVPRRMYVIDGETIRPLPSSGISSPPNSNLSPPVMFRVLRKIGPDGTLLFAENDVVTWRLFVGLLDYLEAENERYYGRIMKSADTINKLILDARTNFSEAQRLVSSPNYTTSKSMKSAYETHKRTYEHCADKAVSLLKDLLRKELEQDVAATTYSESISDEDEEAIASMKTGDKVSLGAKWILHILKRVGRTDSGIPQLLSEIGPYFRLVPAHQQVEHEEFNAFMKMHLDARSNRIKIDGDSQSEWSAVNNIVKLSEAEGLGVPDIKPFIKLTVRAFHYGIALMMPALPFVVTHTIRRFLNERRIPFVFSTHDMAVGINYGLRNVIIVSTDRQPLPPSLVIQMAGRAGRRGLDRDARIIYANVLPIEDIEHIDVHEPLHDMGSQEAVCSSMTRLPTIPIAPFSVQLAWTSLIDSIRKNIPPERRDILKVSMAAIHEMTNPTDLIHTSPIMACEMFNDLRAARRACFQMHTLYTADEGASDAIKARAVRHLAKLIRETHHALMKFSLS